MKKILKIIGKLFAGLVAVLLVFVVIIYVLYNEPIPKGTSGAEADALAEKMLEAVNYEAYKNTRYLGWSFPRGHHYLWDKYQQKVDVSWDDVNVNLDLNAPQKSTVSVNGTFVNQEKALGYIEKARSYFHNDSFWLVAPYKVFDKGVTKSIVHLENGEQGLLVTYASGGTTPGDSYLWKLDQNFRPKGYQMWVSIIPIGGLYASWDDWKATDTGAVLANSHKILFMKIPLENVKAWN